MKKAVYAIILALLVLGCQREQPRYQGDPGQSIRIGTENEINMLKKIVSDDPGNLRAWVDLGNILMDTKRFEEAITAYEKSLELNPKDVDVIVDTGTCYRNIGQPLKAVELYKKGVSINPRHPNAHLNMGVVLAYDLGNLEGAQKEFEKYLEVAPRAENADMIKAEIEKIKNAIENRPKKK